MPLPISMLTTQFSWLFEMHDPHLILPTDRPLWSGSPMAIRCVRTRGGGIVTILPLMGRERRSRYRHHNQSCFRNTTYSSADIPTIALALIHIPEEAAKPG